MTTLTEQQLKNEFKDRLFFYPGDALYVLAIARAMRLKKGEEYRLFSLMGSAELSNTLPLYDAQDFTAPNHRINLHLLLPSTEEKINQLLQDLKAKADANEVGKTPPLTIALLTPKLTDFMPVLRKLTKSPEVFQNLRIVLGTTLPTLYKTELTKMLYGILVLGFNPLDEEWSAYLKRNGRRAHTLIDHMNQLFARQFGFFSISQSPQLPLESEQLKTFITESVIQGIHALETHLDGRTDFGHPDVIRPLIEKFGLLETGGFEVEQTEGI